MHSTPLTNTIVLVYTNSFYNVFSSFIWVHITYNIPRNIFSSKATISLLREVISGCYLLNSGKYQTALRQ